MGLDMKEVKEKAKWLWKKFWFLIWEDESLFGWVFSFLFAIVIIKFVFFPTLSLILGTSMPLVVVESGSMHHPGSFVMNYFGSDKLVEKWWQVAKPWYEERGIYFNNTPAWQLRNGLEIGDVVLIVKAKNLGVGDVIIFEASQKYPVIHRIINVSAINERKVYSTKGDNNAGQLFVEVQIPEDAVLGKAVFHIPLLGWVKLIFVKILEIF